MEDEGEVEHDGDREAEQQRDVGADLLERRENARHRALTCDKQQRQRERGGAAPISRRDSDEIRRQQHKKVLAFSSSSFLFAASNNGKIKFYHLMKQGKVKRRERNANEKTDQKVDEVACDVELSGAAVDVVAVNLREARNRIHWRAHKLEFARICVVE